MFLWLNNAGYYNTLQESAAINPRLGLFPMFHCTTETLLLSSKQKARHGTESPWADVSDTNLEEIRVTTLLSPQGRSHATQTLINRSSLHPTTDFINWGNWFPEKFSILLKARE